MNYTTEIENSTNRFLTSWERSCGLKREIKEINIKPSLQLNSVCQWMKNILNQARCNNETHDLSFAIFFEYMTTPNDDGILHSNNNVNNCDFSEDDSNRFNDLFYMSKIAAVSVVLASKMHETGRKILLQSFSFCDKDELVALEIKLLQTVDLEILGMTPTFFVDTLLTLWSNNMHLDIKIIEIVEERCKNILSLMLTNGCSIAGGPHALAFIAVYITLVEFNIDEITIFKYLNAVVKQVGLDSLIESFETKDNLNTIHNVFLYFNGMLSFESNLMKDNSYNTSNINAIYDNYVFCMRKFLTSLTPQDKNNSNNCNNSQSLRCYSEKDQELDMIDLYSSANCNHSINNNTNTTANNNNNDNNNNTNITTTNNNSSNNNKRKFLKCASPHANSSSPTGINEVENF